MIRKILFGTALAVSVAACPGGALAHSGHDHGAPAAPPPPATEAPGFGGEGFAFQAVLVPEVERTLLYLAGLDDNAPVAGAAIAAEAGTWKGRAEATAAEGVYLLAWTPPPEGAAVTLTVAADGRDDLLLVAEVKPLSPAAASPGAVAPVEHWRHWVGGGGIALAVLAALAFLARLFRGRGAVALLALFWATSAAAHSGHDHGTPETTVPSVQAGRSFAMSKATQFLLGIRTVRVEPREAAETQRVVGRVVPDPAGYARVQSSQPARVVVDPSFAYPVPGQKVTRGDVLLVLEPTLTSLERSEKRGALYRTESEIALLERELGRQEALGGVVAAKTVEASRIRLEQLRKERGQIAGTALGRDLVAAPVDGVVTDVHVVPGEVVTPDRVLVEIVDPTRLRVEAVIHDLAVADRVTGATAATRLFPDRTFPLERLGASPKIDSADHGIHMHFRVAEGQADGLRIGLPVDVHLAVGSTRLRLAVPREAVAEVGGRPVVFIRVGPEAFVARPVGVGRVVGPIAEIEDGLSPGERVVVQGVQQLRAAR
ncbi:MAG: efflux RND transporter periplasmic adaptor subunit [Magnetospirillum sp. WYHS-4]